MRFDHIKTTALRSARSALAAVALIFAAYCGTGTDAASASPLSFPFPAPLYEETPRIFFPAALFTVRGGGGALESALRSVPDIADSFNLMVNDTLSTRAEIIR